MNPHPRYFEYLCYASLLSKHHPVEEVRNYYKRLITWSLIGYVNRNKDI